MDNTIFSQQLLQALGGKTNLIKATNCTTRIRAEVKNPLQVEEETIRKMDGVLGLVKDGSQFQIVLGPGKAKKVADIFNGTYEIPKDEALQEDSLNDWQANKKAVKGQQKQGALRRGLKTISEIFIPLLPAIIAAGLFNGFGSLADTLIGNGTLPKSLTIISLFLKLIGTAFLGYFAIYTGIRSAQVFGATPALGGMIGGISIGANIVEISKLLNLYNEAVPLESILTTGKGGIIGVIFGVWILSKVEKAVRRKVPDLLDLIVTPFVSLLVVGLLFVFVIMPITGFISDGLVSALSVIINSTNPLIRVISGYVLAAVFLPMVLLGLHHGLIPIYAVQLEQMGGVSLFPVLAMAGAGQVGAALAILQIARKNHHMRLEKVITGALPAGFLGVGEPLIYGVTLPMLKPFITAGLGAGFGGAFVMLMQVMGNAWGPSGLVAIPLMQGMGMLWYFVGLVIAYIAGYLITRLVIRDEDVMAV